MKHLWEITCSLSILLAAGSTLLAQSPTGIVAGTVSDPSGAVVPQARITIVNRDTGLSRATITGSEGVYSAAALPAGPYDVRAEANGFSTLMRPTVVEAGSTATVD